MRPEQNVKLTPADLQCIDMAIGYINTHHTEKISADQLSIEIGLSKPKLQAGFLKKHGVTLHKYILQVRISRAKTLLIDTNKPIKAIADASGFPNDSHFCKVFKKWTLTSPAGFRLQQEI